MRKIFYGLLFGLGLGLVSLSAVQVISASGDVAFEEATKIALDIIDSEASRPICQPATVSETKKNALVAALASVTAAGLAADATGLSPLDYAVLADDVPSIRRFIALGYPLDSPGGTLLHGAALSGSMRALSFLLANGADVNATNSYGATPLMVAAAENRVGIARTLLAAGASVKPRTADGGTALLYAIGCRNQELVNVLLKSGAERDPKAKNLALKFGVSLAQQER